VDNRQELTPAEKRLLTAIQEGLPIEPEPFAVLAEQLKTTEEKILEMLAKLKKEGYIRRIGAVFDSRKLGYVSTLCALKVPEDKLKSVAAYINSLPGVTHNYLRQHEYNMWFTLIAPSQEALEDAISGIKKITGISQLLNLPAVNFFKINVNFNLKEGAPDVE
jgi:DNA-binding Lrp family transcriptional regulator